MTTSNLPSKLVRPFGLLVASALLAFSTSAATAAALPYATEVTTIDNALSYLSSITPPATTGSNIGTATASDIQAALVWSATAGASSSITTGSGKTKKTTVFKNTAPISDANAYLFAQALVMDATAAGLAPAAILNDVTTAAEAVKKPVPLSSTQIGAIINTILLSGTTTGAVVKADDASALTLVTNELAAGVSTTGTSNANTPVVLQTAFLNAAIKGADSTFASSVVNAALNFDSASTNALLSGTANGYSIAKGVLALAANKGQLTNLVETLTNSTGAFANNPSAFAAYLASKMGATAATASVAGQIASAEAFSNPGTVANDSAIIMESAITNAPAITATLASMTTCDTIDALANSAVTAILQEKKPTELPLVAQGLANAITISTNITSSGTTEALEKAGDIAAVLYSTAKGYGSSLTEAELNGLLTSMLATKGAMIPKTSATTDLTDAAAFYEALAGDLYATVATLDSSFTSKQATLDTTIAKAIDALLVGDAFKAATSPSLSTVEGLVASATNGTVLPVVTGSSDQATSVVLK